ncbi:acylphosphatase [Geodermatophilus sp. DSM 44513]|uniref:acylphosphatase n=1 Tax=Geodermatophilus sp. DSM 44513 TaxID=1528104 RepID=UPI001273338F|nr:acylphosphatase [Geodermatophilus sp. DSM 44513]WNV74494.1 acylphosphatase [Geodermatophilus sp. DSM 44513]
MRRVVALVSGDVQGVGSAPLQEAAPSVRGVGGSGVLPGPVEVVLEGPDAAVAAVLADLDGPDAPGAVTGVDVRDERVQGDAGFTTA